jgi:hypothetical protein
MAELWVRQGAAASNDWTVFLDVPYALYEQNEFFISKCASRA